MRPIKELLLIMYYNHHLFESGLCSWCFDLYEEQLITFQESELLIKYIKNNRPSKYSSIKAYKYRNSPWYWKEGDISPRIKWIKKHL